MCEWTLWGSLRSSEVGSLPLAMQGGFDRRASKHVRPSGFLEDSVDVASGIYSVFFLLGQNLDVIQVVPAEEASSGP